MYYPFLNWYPFPIVTYLGGVNGFAEILVKQQELEEIIWSLLVGVGVWYSAGFELWRYWV